MKKAADHNGLYKLMVLGIIAAAFLLRLIGLSSSSLTLNEAENALSALHLFGGSSSGQLLYSLPTALIFKIFGDTDFTARLFPALMGSLAVFIPLLLSGRFGRRRMLLLAFLTAVDPVLLFWSKRADAAVPALVLTGAAFAFYLSGKRTAALSCFFIALCGGPRSLPALILMGLGCLALGLVYKTGLFVFSFRKREIAAALAAALVFITACSAYPAGFASFGTGIAESLQAPVAWQRPGITALLVSIAVYCGIPLLLFISGRIRRQQYPLLCVFLAAAVLLLAWQGIMALPWIEALLLMGALERIGEFCEALRGRKNFGSWVAAGAVAGGFSFVYFRAVEVFNQSNGYDAVRIRWNGTDQVLPLTRIGASVLLLTGGLVIVGLIIKILLGFSDSEPIRRGLLAGLAVICSWGLVTNIWNTGGFDRIGDYPASSHLLNSFCPLGGNYTAYQNTPLFEILKETDAKYGDRSKVNYGLNFAADDVLLEWMLRKENGIRKSAGVPSELSDAVLILDRSGTSFAEYGFVGTVLSDRISVDWRGFGILDWGKWLLFGDGVFTSEPPITVWVKGNYVLSNEGQAGLGESE